MQQPVAIINSIAELLGGRERGGGEGEREHPFIKGIKAFIWSTFFIHVSGWVPGARDLLIDKLLNI